MKAIEDATEKDAEFIRLKQEASAAQAAGDFRRADELLSAAAAIKPELALVLGEKALIAHKRREAVRWYVECFNHCANRHLQQICLINIGLIQLDWGFYEPAETLFNKALDIGPSIVALGNLGLLRMYQGRMAEAEQLMRQVVKADPKFSRAQFTLSLILLCLGRFGEGWHRFRHRFKGALKPIAIPQGLWYPEP